MILFERNPKCATCYVIFFLAAMTASSSVSYAGFLKQGVRVLLGRYDTVFKVCNRTDETLQIAIIYEHHWKRGEPSTWPAKGWFVRSPGECSDFAVNNLIGVMSVVRVTKDGKLKPYSTGSTPFKDTSVYNNEAKWFATEYFCIGEAPFEEYRDNLGDYQKCKKGQTKIPFNLMFKHGGGKHYTLNIQ